MFYELLSPILFRHFFVPFGHESYPQVDADAIGIAKNIVINMDEINVLVFLMIIFFLKLNILFTP